MKIAHYRGDVTHIVGETFQSEFIRREGFDSVRMWVATNATYDFLQDRTTVEFDEVGE